jgi:hypothetical protein
MQYSTVIIEKATRHIPDNNIRNRPHSGNAQQSRIICINLKVGNENLIIFRLPCLYTYFFIILCYNHTVLYPGGDVCRCSIDSAYEGAYLQRYDPVPVPPVDHSHPHSPVVT